MLFALRFLTMLSVGVTTSWLVGAAALTTLAVLLPSLVTRFHAGSSAIRPGLPTLGRTATEMAVPFALVGGGVAFSGAATTHLRDAALLIGVITATDVTAILVCRRLQRPVRTIVVGGSGSIARCATRWAGDRSVTIVGGLLLDDAEDTPPVRTLMGVHTVRGTEEVVQWVDRWVADLVVVTPGPGVTSDSVRRLSWLLERTDAALAVLGVIDSVAPHRIDSTVLAGSTLVQVRPSRPSAYVRATKWCLDRVLGLVLLLLSAPVLGALWAWIKLESRGPGFFTQVRIGRDGRPFTLYKLRTMHGDAEQAKAALAHADEGNGVLFKVRRDPRVTRTGRLLRKSSLDELPQLLNVVLGQMSLVGPRPALPCEVARYDEAAHRRLAVLPGMTGLWQVSGRSELTWEQSVDLDLRYTDNYCLSEDLLIALRTLDAVVRPRGAY